jgi:hypothetical protein
MKKNLRIMALVLFALSCITWSASAQTNLMTFDFRLGSQCLTPTGAAFFQIASPGYVPTRTFNLYGAPAGYTGYSFNYTFVIGSTTNQLEITNLPAGDYAVEMIQTDQLDPTVYYTEIDSFTILQSDPSPTFSITSPSVLLNCDSIPITAVINSNNIPSDSIIGNSAVAASTGQHGMVNNHIYNKIYIPYNGDIASLTANVVQRNVGDSIQLVLYSDNGGMPGTILTSSNNQNATLGNNYFPIPNTTLAAGDYWIAVRASGAVGLNLNWLSSIPNNSAIIDNTKNFSDPFINNPSGLTTFASTYDVGVGTTLFYLLPPTFNWQPTATLANFNSLNPIAFPSSPTVYTITATNSNGCTGSATYSAVPAGNLNITANATNINVCQGEATKLYFTNTSNNANTSSFSYFWAGVNSGINHTDSTTVYPSANTTYTAFVNDGNGCLKTDTVNVFVTPTPSYYGGNYSFCGGSGVLSAVQNTSGNSFQWYKEGVLLAGQTFDTLTVTASGYYNVVISNNLNCMFDTTGNGSTVTLGVGGSENYTTSRATACQGNDFIIYNNNKIVNSINNIVPNSISTFSSFQALNGSYSFNQGGDSLQITSSPSNPGVYQLEISNFSYGSNLYDTVSFNYYYTDTTAIGKGKLFVEDQYGNRYFEETTNASNGAKSGIIKMLWGSEITIGFDNKLAATAGTAQVIISNFVHTYATDVNFVAYYADSNLQNQLGGSYLGEFYAPTDSVGLNTVYAVATAFGATCAGATTAITYSVTPSPTISNVSVISSYNNPVNASTICGQEPVMFIANNPNQYALTWRYNGTIGDTAFKSKASGAEVALQFDFHIDIADNNGCLGSYNFSQDMPPVVFHYATGTLTASDDEICSGQPVVINHTGTQNVTFTNGYVEGTNDYPNTNTRYTAILVSPTNGCTDYHDINVIVNSTPKIDSVTTSAPPCIGTAYTITAHTRNTSTNYSQTVVPYALEPINNTPIYVVKNGQAAIPFTTGGAGGGVSEAINLPFDFEFFGNTHNQLWLSTQGSLTFDVRERQNSLNIYGIMPSPTDKRAVINFAMGQLFFLDANAEMYYSIEGTAPNRKFVMNYSTLISNSPTFIPLRGQVVLYEGSNNIKVSIDTLYATNLSGQFVIGIQNKDRNEGFCLTGGTCATGIPQIYNKTWLLQPSAPYNNFSWISTTTAPNLFYTNSVAVNNGTARSYNLTITKPDGCNATQSIAITPNAAPTVMATVDKNFVCEGNTVTPIGTGNATSYTWSNGVINNTPTAVTIAGNTTYTVTGTSAQGCTATSTVAVTAALGTQDISNTYPNNATTYASTATFTQDQPEGIVTDYRSGIACWLMFSLFDSTGGNSLGSVTGTITTTPSIYFANSQPYAKRACTITPTNQGPATVTLYFTQDDFDDYNANKGANLSMPTTGNNTDPNKVNIIVTKVDGGSLTTGTLTDIFPNSVTWNAAANRWEITVAVNSFSTFYIKTTTNATPLNLSIALSGKNTSLGNELKFTTSVKDAIEYEIQKSVLGKDFSTIEKIANNPNTTIYEYLDNQVFEKTSNYRIVAITPAAKQYSNVLEISTTSAVQGGFTMYPNPTNGLLSIITTDNIKGNIQFKITNALGQVVKVIYTTMDNSRKVDIDLTNFAPGFYSIEYSGANKIPVTIGKVFKN